MAFDPVPPAWSMIQRFMHDDGSTPLLLHWRDGFRSWRNGAWRPVDLGTLESRVSKLLVDLGETLTLSKVKEVVGAMKHQLHLPADVEPGSWIKYTPGLSAFELDTSHGTGSAGRPTEIALRSEILRLDPDIS